MIKASKYFFISACALISLTGCENHDGEPDVNYNPDCPTFSAIIETVNTRAVNQQWEAGDEIGITSATSSNICHQTKDGQGNFNVKNSSEQIYFKNENEEIFSAYYPWKQLATGTVKIDSDTKNQTGQKSFDFLWAQSSGKKNNPKVAFNFAHKMTKLVLTIRRGQGLTFDIVKGATLSLKGLSHSGSFNTSDGSVTVNSSANNETWEFSNETYKPLPTVNDAENTITYSFILFPQELTAPLEFRAGLPSDNLTANIDFTAANREKDGSSAKNQLVGGRQYNLSVTLNKTALLFDNCSINPWNEVSAGNISAESE